MLEKKEDKRQKEMIFKIDGRVQLEAAECESTPNLKAYVFDRLGRLLGEENVGEDGHFSVKLAIAEPIGIEVLISPPGDSKEVRRSTAYKKIFKNEDWIKEGKEFVLKPTLVLPYDIWKQFWPKWICVSGHVRKVLTNLKACPVPFLKVEVFDVDREMCWWPFIIKNLDLVMDRKVIRVPELLRKPPFPPEPLTSVREVSLAYAKGLEKVALNPQPLPPREDLSKEISVEAADMMTKEPAFTRVGEMTSLDPSISVRLEKLTLTSKLPPWMIFPWCFYSKALVCETYTDCDGYFRCCFPWYPFHFRRGRLRFDSRPDIIIKVTQIINGIETVLYMDPYTSTRWNFTNAHIDLYLDNENIECGYCHSGDRPTGTQVFFTRIGDDEVYKINQATGLYSEPPLSNVAYGESLLIYAQFGDALSNGSPQKYYRLSYSRDNVNFIPITAPLNDTRVNKITIYSETHALGPLTVNGVPALYEIRDFSHYYWYNPDWIGIWDSTLSEDDTGKYILRLEIFDQNGVKLTSAQVDYRDGTAIPPAVLPPMMNGPNRADWCDLIITLDNKPPELDLSIPVLLSVPEVCRSCGVIPWNAVPPLNLDVKVVQENGRLYAWGLYYTKGVGPAGGTLASNTNNNGNPASVSQSVPGDSMLVGLTTTCAFALKLWAYPHIRNGRYFVHYREKLAGIVIDKCPTPCGQ